LRRRLDDRRGREPPGDHDHHHVERQEVASGPRGAERRHQGQLKNMPEFKNN
jgi:hypothetical protein